MTCKAALLLLLVSCTPMEREVAEEIIQEVVEDVEETPCYYNSDTLPHPNQLNELPSGIPYEPQKNSPQMRRSNEKGRKGVQKENSNGKKA